ncbi:MAG: hypothetical protein LUD72_06770 [Bacteroidales bacterium]|nr:hypothetical protein [Bacteroidales bacterium]
MSERARIYCDKCGEPIEKLVIQEAKLAGNEALTERFFVCPSCGAHYTITFTDENMEKMIKKRRKVPETIHSMLGKGISTRRIINRDIQMKNELKSRNSELIKADQN